jgi:hypothetical protein
MITTIIVVAIIAAIIRIIRIFRKTVPVSVKGNNILK